MVRTQKFRPLEKECGTRFNLATVDKIAEGAKEVL
jgi:hypothetical protein